MAPANENECRQMLYTGYTLDGPSSVRYPRGSGPGEPVDETMQAIPVGEAVQLKHGKHVALLAFGTMLEPAQKLAEELGYSVVNMRFVKPLDTKLIDTLAATHKLLITIEENAVAGGAGAGVAEYLSTTDSVTPVKLIGLPDEFVEHGDRNELLAHCLLDEAGLRTQVTAAVSAEDALRKFG